MCGIDPKNELKYRKKCSEVLISMVAEDIVVEGELDKDANLLIGNHTINLDVPLMEVIIPEKLIWISKKELENVPIIKYLVTKTDMILTDRTDKRSIIKMMRDIKDRVNRGYKVVLFPEGTRNQKNPKKMIAWKKGPKGIAEKLNLKVQPFVIINLPFVIEKNPLRIKKKKLKVIFLESFYPKDKPNWYEETKEKMQQIITKEYEHDGKN
jgi:1-acyl-sn-glycerol-3-phosphate acyltransferase